MPDATPYDPIAAGERAIADAPLTMRATRASGPGGQHVNTTDSAVTISVAVDDLTLDEAQREQLTKRLRTRISAAGLLTASAQDERSQHQNRRIARERLARMIGEAAAAAHAAPADAAGSRGSRAEARREAPDLRPQARPPGPRRRRLASPSGAHPHLTGSHGTA